MDQHAPALPFLAEAQYKTHTETSLQLQASAAVTISDEVKGLLLSFAWHATEILSKREEDLLTPMARAAVYVCPESWIAPLRRLGIVK